MKTVVFVNRLPKTRSGKILRKLLRDMVDGNQFQIPSTIDDAGVIEELELSLNAVKVLDI